MHTGKVKWFNDFKGYGFASLDDGREVFIHYSEIKCEGFKTLSVDQSIEFDLYEQPKGLVAKNIIKL